MLVTLHSLFIGAGIPWWHTLSALCSPVYINRELSALYWSHSVPPWFTQPSTGQPAVQHGPPLWRPLTSGSLLWPSSVLEYFKMQHKEKVVNLDILGTRARNVRNTNVSLSSTLATHFLTQEAWAMWPPHRAMRKLTGLGDCLAVSLPRRPSSPMFNSLFKSLWSGNCHTLPFWFLQHSVQLDIWQRGHPF